MTVDEILEVSKRLQEPVEPGVYYVFSTWLQEKPKYKTKIKVFRGPRGGYHKPREIDSRKAFYWQNNWHFWLTKEEAQVFLDSIDE